MRRKLATPRPHQLARRVLPSVGKTCKPGYGCKLETRPGTTIDGYRLVYCEKVYEPAEDTWLAASMIAGDGRGIRLCVDIGTGTGILALTCFTRLALHTVIAIDVNPCAAYCAKKNAEIWGAEIVVNVVQCSHATCIRGGIDGVLVVYNTPYLPVEEKPLDDCLDEVATTGGISEALHAIGEAERISGGKNACIVLVFSSLSNPQGDPLNDVLGSLHEKGFRVESIRKQHFFFEDIIAVKACKR